MIFKSIHSKLDQILLRLLPVPIQPNTLTEKQLDVLDALDTYCVKQAKNSFPSHFEIRLISVPVKDAQRDTETVIELFKSQVISDICYMPRSLAWIHNQDFWLIAIGTRVSAQVHTDLELAMFLSLLTTTNEARAL